MRRLLGLLVVLPLACTVNENSNSNTNPPAGDGDASVEPTTCTPVDPAVVLSADVLGGVSLDLTDDHLGFGYVDSKNIPTVQSYALEDASVVTGQWKSSPVLAKYGNGYISTSLAHQGDRFGFGWYSERPYDTGTIWGTTFGTVGITTGTTSSATLGNSDHGRNGVDDSVQAIGPVVSATRDGFFMTWDDTRDKEPTTLNVNLAYWEGIYGRAYTSTGKASGADVQIAQPTRADSFAMVVDASRTTAIWSSNDGKFTSNIYARALPENITPAIAPDPVASVKDNGSNLHIAAAVGEDGRALVVGARKLTSNDPILGWMMISTVGQMLVKYADWPEMGFDQPTVVATTGGYIVAAFHNVPGANGVHFYFLDLDGARTGETQIDLPDLPADSTASNLRIRPTTDGVRAVFTIAGKRTAGASHVDAQMLTACKPVE